MKKYKIAVLDDYQNVALESADWSVLRDRADIAVFQDHLADPDAVIERLLPFDVVCVMRERTPLTRNVIERLSNLKLIASTGLGNASIRIYLGADLGLRATYRDGEQFRPIRRLAANSQSERNSQSEACGTWLRSR
jgi:phosphoglycerate dehydrogenase-like enzyme